MFRKMTETMLCISHEIFFFHYFQGSKLRYLSKFCELKLEWGIKYDVIFTVSRQATFNFRRFEESRGRNSQCENVVRYERFLPRCEASSMRRICGVGEISKIIPTSIVSTVVPPANTVSGTALCQQTTGRGNSRNPRHPNWRPLFVHLTQRGPWLVTDLGAEDLWHIGNTRRTQFTAHYLARSPLHLAFSSTGVIHRRLLRLEPFTLSFFRLVYIDSCAIYSVFIFLLLFIAFSNSNFAILFIPLYFYSYISSSLSFSFVLAFYYLVLSSSFFLFFSSSLQDSVFSFPSYSYHSPYLYCLFLSSFILILFFCFRLHIYLQRT